MTKTVVLVTGAGGGLGNAIARRFASELSADSLLLLTSRNKAALEGENWLKSVPSAVLQWDLAQPDTARYQADLGKFAGRYDRAIVIHNAARWGKIPTAVKDMADIADLQAQLTINVSSMLAVNSVFLSYFADAAEKVVVNITGGSAVDPTPGFGYLCMVKAAREMILNVLVKENADVKVLHFNPGLVDTGSLQSVRDESTDAATRQWIAGAFDTGAVWSAERVADALFGRLSTPFVSGLRVSATDTL